MYNSDTVYSTTTFRPVSPSPSPAPPASPLRTRKLETPKLEAPKLETPLHFDGGLFSDIRSKDGKLLSKVTVDRVHCASRRDVTDSPSRFHSVGAHGNDYVDDILKTETITNEEVIKVKFTPVPLELRSSPRLLTPSQFQAERPQTPVPYIKDGYEDLQSYKIVNSICKERLLESQNLSKSFERLDVREPVMRSVSPLAGFLASEPIRRSPSPLANFLVSEQLTKIDHYLQESLDACAGREVGAAPPPPAQGGTVTHKPEDNTFDSSPISSTSDRKEDVTNYTTQSYSPTDISPVEECKNKRKVNSVKEKEPGVLRAIYNMPVHYHAIILCFFLIVYNLIYQYVKENCHGKK